MNRIEFLLNNEIPVIIIDDYYDESELKLIWEELNFFTYSHKLRGPEQTGGAFGDDMMGLKINSGLFLDAVWMNDRKLSNILTVTQKLLSNDMKLIKESPSWFFKLARDLRVTTLISYYEDGGYYAPHFDNAYATVLNWYFKEPKHFTGGNLKLHYDNEVKTIEIKNNRTIIFPSSVMHEVTPVSMEKQYENQKLGRYCITQFLSTPL